MRFMRTVFYSRNLQRNYLRIMPRSWRERRIMVNLLEQIGAFFQSQALRYSKWQADRKLLLGGLKRASDWSQFVREYAKIVPKKCSIIVCKKKDIELHHSDEPFHVNPAREKDPTNLRWLCRTHHHQIGHLFDWKSWCENFDEVVRIINDKIASRP